MKKFWKEWFLLQPAPDPGWSRIRREFYYAYRIVLLLCAGLGMGIVLLAMAVGPYDREIFNDYFQFRQILILNTVPVALLVLLLYGVTGRAGASFLLGGGVAAGLSLGNYFKLHFRDDPLYFEDLLILREARAMVTGDHYALFVDRWIIAALCCLVLGWLLLHFLAPGAARPWYRRLITLAVSMAAAAAVLSVCFDTRTYLHTQNYAHVNKWSATQDYISHGFVYPFLYNLSDVVERPPEGYTKGRAEDLLSAYPDADIPAGRRISVIGLMREAYADFSQYGVEGLDVSGYDVYHALEAESYTGDLVTNIFAAGTVDTERCFLTGSYKLRDFHSDANSYVWYFRDQGYTVQGSHPFHEWFYNRLRINAYLGFSQYRFLEGDYEKLTQADYPEDSILLPEIYQDFRAAEKPCFSFSVNVQSHGPYAIWDTGADEYLTGDYTLECRNAMNRYMTTIMETDRELAKFIDQLRRDPEPVVLVTFGDHLPWMGDGNIFYDEMGIDIDPSTDGGFFRYYTTRYLIWANDAAKEIIGHDVRGEGPAISPCYLMNVLFDQIGWAGPGFMQAMDEMMEVFPVVSTTGRTVTDGVLTDEVPAQRHDLFRKFEYMQHYWRREFLYQDAEK